MKSFKILFTFAFVLCFGMSYGQMTVASTNNIGIGTDAPNVIGFGATAKVMTLNGTGGSIAEFTANRGGNNQTVGFFSFINTTGGSTDRVADFSVTRNANNKSGNFSIRVNNGTGGVAGGNMISRLTVQHTDGFVGIGTSAPTERLHVNGNIFHSGTITMSDSRLKRNVQSFDLGLREVMALNTITYEYNGKGGSIDGDSHIGIYAQDLQKVAPSLVKEFTHQILEQENDVEGTLKKVGEETFLAIKDNEIKFMLLNAIQDQQEIIEDLQSRIEQLEAQVKK